MNEYVASTFPFGTDFVTHSTSGVPPPDGGAVTVNVIDAEADSLSDVVAVTV